MKRWLNRDTRRWLVRDAWLWLLPFTVGYMAGIAATNRASWLVFLAMVVIIAIASDRQWRYIERRDAAREVHYYYHSRPPTG